MTPADAGRSDEAVPQAAATSPYREFLFGWPVVAAALLGIALGMSPLPFYTVGVFVGPLAAEFGWSAGDILGGLAVFTIAAVIAAPLVGALTDRLGVRRVALSSIVTFSLAFMAFALNTGSLGLFYVLWAVLAVCGVGTLPITFTRAVSNWFHRKRGLALGIALIGTGISGALAKLLAAHVVTLAGWRAAYLAVGILPVLIALPACYFLLRDIDDPAVAARARQLRALKAEDRGGATFGLTLGEALGDWRFWLMAAVFAPLSFAIGGPIPNLETLLGQQGFSYLDAVFLASCLGYAVFAGRLAGGYLLDHLWAPLVACLLLILPAASMYLFQQPSLGYYEALLAICLLGVAAGMEFDLLAYLVSRYFGIRAYSAIYGVMYAFFALGAGFGPAVFARFLDATGSYDLPLTWAMWAFILCSLGLLLLGPYRDAELRAMSGPGHGS